MDPNIMFVAGRIAGERGWADATLVTASQLPGVEPSGSPLVLVAASSEVDELTARLVASVDYVARPIMVVTDKPLSSAASAWINPEIVQSVEKNSVPKLVPMDTNQKEELSAHERREKEKLDELKKVQPTPHLVPDQSKSEGSSGKGDGKSTPAKSAPSKAEQEKAAAKAASGDAKSAKPAPAAKDSKAEDEKKATADKAPAAKSQPKPPPPNKDTRASASKSTSGSSKGSASAEAMREFRSLASD